jgi:hypothetical protein
MALEVKMGFLKNFFTNVFKESDEVTTQNSFAELSEQQLESHLKVVKYDDFVLTDAVRPSYDLKVVPVQGYRHESYHDPESQSTVPVLMSATTRANVFETFIELLDPLGGVVDVVLESSHDRNAPVLDDLYREHIDMPVLKSILYEYEELLTHDGCTGIAVLNPRVPLEVQFDEHKLLIVYGTQLNPFESVLEQNGVMCNDTMQFITEAEHVHSSCEEYLEKFHILKTELGMDTDYSNC